MAKLSSEIMSNEFDIIKNSGVLLVDKPSRWTSFDVVNLVKKRFRKKVGHCGTLDPAGTGLLVLVIDKATKLSQKLSGENKVYKATVLLGTETDSMDMEGKQISEKSWEHITEEELLKAEEKFLGKQYQLPPMVSAKKHKGKKLYEFAREGKEVEREEKEININSLRIYNINLPYFDMDIDCSKGTYIRTLASDIGKFLDSCGTLYSLRRIKSGNFDISNAYSVEDIKSWNKDELNKKIIPITELKKDYIDF